MSDEPAAFSNQDQQDLFLHGSGDNVLIPTSNNSCRLQRPMRKKNSVKSYVIRGTSGAVHSQLLSWLELTQTHPHTITHVVCYVTLTKIPKLIHSFVVISISCKVYEQITQNGMLKVLYLRKIVPSVTVSLLNFLPHRHYTDVALQLKAYTFVLLYLLIKD